MTGAFIALGLGTTTSNAAEWDGAYAGLLTGTYEINGGGSATFNAARLGYNLQAGNLVYGGESWQYGLGAEAMIGQSVSVRFEAAQIQRDGVGFVGNAFSLGLGWNF